jgi:hypothetical protein
MTGQLPSGLDYVRTTDVFDHEHHPAGLRRAHRVAAGPAVGTESTGLEAT